MTRVVQVGVGSSAASGGPDNGGGGHGPVRLREARHAWGYEVTPASGPDVAAWCGGEWDAANRRVVLAGPSLQGSTASVGDWVMHADLGVGAWDESAPPGEAGEPPLFFVASRETQRRGYEHAPESGGGAR